MLGPRVLYGPAALSALSGVTSAIGVFGQAATGGSSAQVGDLISAGGSFSAAAALVYIVKKLTDGQLVSREPAKVEAHLSEQLDRSHDLHAASLDRERRLEELYRHAIEGRQP